MAGPAAGASLPVCKLLGQSLESSHWRDFLSKYVNELELKNHAETTFCFCRPIGVELVFDPEKGLSLPAKLLSAVHVYAVRNGFSACPLQTPSVSLAMTGAKVVSLLGEPSRKSGGGVNNIVLTYEGRTAPACSACGGSHNIEIEFNTTSWSRSDAAISSICYY